MSEIELKARELLAAAYEAEGFAKHAAKTRAGLKFTAVYEQVVMRALIAAIAGSQSDVGIPTSVPQWQPIESAPKDGSLIIACYAPLYDKNGFAPLAVSWRTYHPNAQGKEEWRDAQGAKVRAITHWQPLPAPPEVEG